jgi:uncharacterized protein (TIGR04141 family)
MAKQRKTKEPSRPFSIFLLKQGFNADNALEEKNRMEKVDATDLPVGAVMHVLDSAPKEPWWRPYFGVEKELKQVQKGALVFLPVKDRWFALSFGHVYHHVKEEAFEYDFGLLVTLNCLNPKEVKSADMVAPGAARRKRTQVPSTTDLTYLDFDSNSEIIRSLTGSVKEDYAELFKSATGSTALKVGLKLIPDQIPALCENLLTLYASEDYKESFPNITNVVPVKDPVEINRLDKLLVELFRDKNPVIALSIPDIIDYRDNICSRFHADGRWSDIYGDPSIESFYDFLGEEFDFAAIDIGALKSYRMVLTDPDGVPATPYSIYRSALVEIEDDSGVVFHLCDGKWYQIEKDFLTRLQTYIDAKCAPNTLPPYNHDDERDGKQIYSEGKYNESVPLIDGRYICLDREDIRPQGATEIEPCDLYLVDEGGRAKLHHIKISTRSAQLSHLFNQGLNSIELLKANKVSQLKLKALIEARIAENDLESYVRPIDDRKYEVIFGIITKLDSDNRSKNLPLFSQISLKRSMEQLDLMEIPTSLVFIPDESPAKESHPRYPSIIVEVHAGVKGRNEVRPIVGQAGYDPGQDVKRTPKNIREAAVGSRFKILAKLEDGGAISTHSIWPYEAV